mgnify:FL=1
MENGTIVLKAVGTKEQLADVMTKILGRQAFLRFRDIITSEVKLNDSLILYSFYSIISFIYFIIHINEVS